MPKFRGSTVIRGLNDHAELPTEVMTPLLRRKAAEAGLEPARCFFPLR
jgi:hypothetical protein